MVPKQESSQNEEAFKITKHGIKTIKNIYKNGSEPSQNKLANFVAQSFAILGIKKVLGYNTMIEVGSGEFFDEFGNSEGRRPLYNFGFQKRKI